MGAAMARGRSARSLTLAQADRDLDALRDRADFPRLLDLLLDRGFPDGPFAR
jgi:hypothetical protein